VMEDYKLGNWQKRIEEVKMKLIEATEITLYPTLSLRFINVGKLKTKKKKEEDEQEEEEEEEEEEKEEEEEEE
jgi:hypothetical protein